MVGERLSRSPSGKRHPSLSSNEDTMGVPEVDPVDSEEEEDAESVYDSEEGANGQGDFSGGDEDNEEEDEDEDFEDQGSSEDDEEVMENQEKEDESEDDIAIAFEKVPRTWPTSSSSSGRMKRLTPGASPQQPSAWMHTDDWSSDEDDEEGTGNRIGKVPLHWYDEYDHIGYDATGKKIEKSASRGDRIDQALAMQENRAKGKFIVHDALNDREVELSARQLELIRRVQAGAYAHPEHDATPDYIDYFSGVDPEISGLNSDKYEPKSRFQPNKYEQMQVQKLLDKLKEGRINMDYLTGKIRDMRDAKGKQDPNKPFMLWTGDEEDLLSTRKGPQHIAAPKVPPPGHAESYIPPDEYLPTQDDLEKWKEMPPEDRPHGHFIPKKFPNLRSVGAYQHSVREAFERCLDLYLCPRVMKRRLNIDPESLVPRLPRANDLKPFPTAMCIEYVTPFEGDTAPVVRCVTASSDGQFLASGASDGFVRLFEVASGRLLRSWNLSAAVSSDTMDESIKMQVAPVVSIEWNPNRAHHCLLAAVGCCVVVIATGTASRKDAEFTDSLLASAVKGGNIPSAKAIKAVKWTAVTAKCPDRPVSASDVNVGPICILRTTKEVGNVRWHAKGDYFVSVSPKAGSAAVLIHQLSKSTSQQPFSKTKGDAQLACFHPNKPFLFVASQQHVRVYHLVKQSMVKRLVSGCRWISSMDVHPTGDHLIIGSLDRRVVWFDLDLSTTPYKTLKYHERAVRSCQYHRRYPLMASASDDGAVHIFHSMVYSDLMRNPLIVPVKILRGHDVTNNNNSKLGVLTVYFHPTQPWIFTGGADGKIILWQDI